MVQSMISLELTCFCMGGKPCGFSVGAFGEKCPTLTVGSFIRRVRSTFLFICSTTFVLQQLELQRFQALEAQNLVHNKTDVQNLENIQHTKDPPLVIFVFSLKNSFQHYKTFFANFWIAPKCPAFTCCDILQQNGCSKFLLMYPKGPPSFLSYFAKNGVSKSPIKWSPFTVL